MSQKHKAKAVIIHCIDFRFQKIIQEEIEKRGLVGQFDRISHPGASRNFQTVSKSCQLSLELHDPDEAIIIEHVDCGAYGEDNLPDTHKRNAQKLKEFLEKLKPEIKVIILLAAFDGIKKL